jgi:hypothetical protein
MPQVGNKKYPYTAAGKKAATAAKKKKKAKPASPMSSKVKTRGGY